MRDKLKLRFRSLISVTAAGVFFSVVFMSGGVIYWLIGRSESAMEMTWNRAGDYVVLMNFVHLVLYLILIVLCRRCMKSANCEESSPESRH